jgi:hypothetical protein
MERLTPRKRRKALAVTILVENQTERTSPRCLQPSSFLACLEHILSSGIRVEHRFSGALQSRV